MHKLLLPTMVLFAVSTALTAAPACTTQSLNSYISLGATGCDIGNFNFSHFDWLATVVAVNTTGGDPNSIIVTAHDNGSAGPSLDFGLNWGTNLAILPALGNATLAFRVTSNDPVNYLLTSSFLHVDASGTGLLGTAIVTETNCVGGLFTGNLCLLPGGLGTTGSVGLGGLINTGVGAQVAVAPFLAPVTTLDVLKTISIVSSGTPLTPSTVHLNSITESFGAAAPEPSTWLLLSSSLALCFVKRLRFKTKA